MRFPRLGLLLLGLGAIPAFAEPAAEARFEPSTQEVLSCLVEPSRRVLVASAAPGIARRVAFERGDIVRAGDVLLELNGESERASLALAAERAEFARRKLARNREMASRQLLSAQEVDDLRTEARLAELDAVRARVELDRRSTLSPFSGLITERRVTQGEYVTAEPFAELISLDPLHVEVTMRAEVFGRIRPGMRAGIALSAPVGRTREGAVSIVDRAIDSGSGTFRIRVVIPNPGMDMPSGIACRVLSVAAPDS